MFERSSPFAMLAFSEKSGADFFVIFNCEVFADLQEIAKTLSVIKMVFNITLPNVLVFES